MNGFTDKDVPDLHGKCLIVTGANAGVGFAASTVLAGKGARVLLACRDGDKAEAAMARIKAAHPAADLAFLPLDLADIDSVRRAADLAAKEPRLDVLLNNAGVMMPPLGHTAQGYEMQFGVNHLGTFALSALLLPKLAQTPGARVVTTASLAHKRGVMNWDDLSAHQQYGPNTCYSQSKLANLLFLLELDRRLQAAHSSVMALGCHPGVAVTELSRHLPPLVQWAWPVLGLLLNSAEQGAWPSLQAATDPAVVAGGYYGPQGFMEARGVSGPASRRPQALDVAAARRLWDVSIEMTGIDPGLAPA